MRNKGALLSLPLALLLLGLALFLLRYYQAGAVGQWSQLAPTGGPPAARFGHTAVYDAANNRMTAFDGDNSNCFSINDLWVLQNANGLGGTPNWAQLSASGGPPPARGRHTAVYDSQNNRMTIFGGLQSCSSGTQRNDVWVLSNANGLGGTPAWTELSPTGGPPGARYDHAAVYDANTNRMIVFGGVATTKFNDVWVLTNANGLGGTPTWSQLTPSGGPPAGRQGPTAVYDPASNRMVVFGGLTSAFSNDVWVLTNANGLGGTPTWIQLSPTGGPPPGRCCGTAVYDAASNRMIVFAGLGFVSANDVWVLTNANGLGGTPEWINLSPSGGPPAARMSPLASTSRAPSPTPSPACPSPTAPTPSPSASTMR
ncbi:MAG: hypothetical protein HYS09_04400 [Chloroflexi bacterium]|nr:hypothetical protein [Chloroflexota bacterium]